MVGGGERTDDGKTDGLTRPFSQFITSVSQLQSHQSVV